MSCKYNNCKHCGYKSECEIYKENTELEEKISILLSCKNCSENKGGLLCQKEYEGKCLLQKTQYIKELQEENEELKKGLGCETCQIHLEYMSLNNRIADLEKENAELKEEIKKSSTNIGEVYVEQPYKGSPLEKKKQLEQAKELLKRLTETTNPVYFDEDRQRFRELKIEAEQFLK